MKTYSWFRGIANKELTLKKKLNEMASRNFGNLRRVCDNSAFPQKPINLIFQSVLQFLEFRLQAHGHRLKVK
jgi:hypothetical protein